MATFVGASIELNSSSMKISRKPDARPYGPPPEAAVRILTVGELINGKRRIVPEQQARLGFESEGLGLKLWCAGNPTLVQRPSVAIVGTRNVSPDGAARARRLAKELTYHGVIVFSGLAK